MKPQLLQIQSPGAHRPHGVPWLRLGFRPFYICAAAMAVVNIGWWALVSTGLGGGPTRLSPLLWHAHEMLWGFAAAVVIGFLFTAGKNWTQLPTPRGAPLLALVLLWLGARLAAVWAPPVIFMALDLALLPVVSLILLRVLLRAGNHRNLPLVGILLLLSLANLAFHLAESGALPMSALQALHAALSLVAVLIMVMAGRVIPGFTMNALPSVRISALPWLERTCIALGAAGLALWTADALPLFTGVVLVVASAANWLRWLRWQPWKSAGAPMVWILHAAYAWLPLGLLLLALAQWQWVPVSLGVHALGVGALGGMVLGMITRTARGHTGRSLRATRLEVLAFALVTLAACVRVLPLLWWPALHNAVVLIAALLWCSAFGIYLWVYTPWLLSARVDGRDG